MSDEAPRTLGRYVDLRLLGQGGMGAVYRARDPSLDREVAVKIMRDPSPEFAQRFRREARAVARLSHPNVVQVYDFGEDATGAPYFVMELCAGQSLEQVLTERGRLPPAMVVDVLLQATRGLRAAHELGLVHRDIKPANLFLTTDGVVKLLDFGIVHMEEGNALTKPASLMGTPHYMSPEMLSGLKVDARADLYALGLVAFHLLAGQPPFEAPSAVAVAMKHLQEPLPDLQKRVPETPTALCELVQRLSQKDPAARPQSAAELQGLLEDLTERLKSDTGRSFTPAAPGAAGPSRSKVVIAAGAGLLVAVGLTLMAIPMLRRGHGPTGGGADGGQEQARVLAPDLGQRTSDAVRVPIGEGHEAPKEATPLMRDGRLRVAVLKFKNLGGERDLELLTEGIGETLLTDLAGIGKLQLIERNQVDQALGEIDFGQTKYVDKGTAAALGKIRGAEVAVQGGYQRADGALRVTARLVRIETGEILDTLMVTGPAKDIFGLQGRVAAEMKRHLLALLK